MSDRGKALFLQLWQRSQLAQLPAPPPAARWPLLLGVCTAIWLSYYLYAGSLGLPYLQEDSTHMLWLASRNPLDPFLSAAGAPAYRPLGKSIIKIWYLLLGRHDIAWLRFHNIAFNALNISLIGLLASRLDRSRHRYLSGGFSAIFFAALPFAFQAIPWINNFFYPLENLLLLGMTAVYWRARARHSRRLLLLALLLCFLAPFQIEYGAMASGILFTLEIIWWRQGRQAVPWLGGVLFALIVNSLYVLRWMTIPKEDYGFGFPSLNRLFLIGTYFLQGLLYPVSPLARPLMENSSLNDVTAIWLVCLPALLLLLGFLLRRRQWWILLLGGAWFLLLNMPALVFVNFDYVVNSPRLLYPPGVGIAWLWGTAAAAFAMPASQTGGSARLLRPALALAFLFAVLTLNARFVRDRIFHHRLAEQPVQQLTAVARQTPPEEQLLIVNFPSWMNPKWEIFAMGHHGAAILPFYIGLDALVAATNEEAQAVREIQVTSLRDEQPYYYGMLGEKVDYGTLRTHLQQSGDVYLTRWGADAISLGYAGRVTAVSPIAAQVTYDDRLALQLTDHEIGERTITLNLNWQILQKTEQDLTVFVHLYAPDGSLVTQADGYPLLGLSPFWLWEAGQQLWDRRTLTLPPDAPPGPYRVAVGLYDPASGARLPAINAQGARAADDAPILLNVPGDQ